LSISEEVNAVLGFVRNGSFFVVSVCGLIAAQFQTFAARMALLQVIDASAYGCYREPFVSEH
jgi:hypothetical protein